jgi:hypothetical protein
VIVYPQELAMKLVLAIDTDSSEVKQKRRPVLVYAWSIIKGVRKTYGASKSHELDYDLLDAPGIEVAS